MAEKKGTPRALGPRPRLADLAHALTVEDILDWMGANRTLREVLAKSTIAPISDRQRVVRVISESKLQQAIVLAARENVGSILVTAHQRANARLLGILTKSAMVTALRAKVDRREKQVDEVMLRGISGIILPLGSLLYSVFYYLFDRQVSHIVVRDGSHTQGIISVRDVVQFLYHCVPEEPVLNCSLSGVLPALIQYRGTVTDHRIPAEDCAFESSTLEHAVDLMARFKQSAVVVWRDTQTDEVADVLTEGDIVRWFALEQADGIGLDAPIKRVLHYVRRQPFRRHHPHCLVRVNAEDSIQRAMGLMVGTGVRHLLIELDGRIVPELLTPQAIFTHIVESYPHDILCQPEPRMEEK